MSAETHRACTSEEHDAVNGKIHGLCVICGVPFPCAYVDELSKLRDAVAWVFDKTASPKDERQREVAVWFRIRCNGEVPAIALIAAHEEARKQ